MMNITEYCKECISSVIKDHRAVLLECISRNQYESFRQVIYTGLKEKISTDDLTLNFEDERDSPWDMNDVGKEFVARCKIVLTHHCLMSKYEWDGLPIPRRVLALMMSDCIYWQNHNITLRRIGNNVQTTD